MPRSPTKPVNIDKPRTTEEFRERLVGERHLFTNRMLDAGAWVLENQRVVALETLSVMTRESQLNPSIFVLSLIHI